MILKLFTNEFQCMFLFILATIGYTYFDRFLAKKNIEGRYYFLHSINNAVITYCTYPSVLYSYAHITTFYNYERSIIAPILTGSLHTYHIIEYKHKFTYYDYLHHTIMCFVALPFGLYINSGSLFDHSLFYTTGLPGMIDYFLLFLVRNDKIKKITEKKFNNYINLWIRCPGCISTAVLSMVAFCYAPDNTFSLKERIIVLLTAFIVFWNGIYFMNLVVVDYAQQKLIKGRKIT